MQSVKLENLILYEGVLYCTYVVRMETSHTVKITEKGRIKALVIVKELHKQVTATGML